MAIIDVHVLIHANSHKKQRIIFFWSKIYDSLLIDIQVVDDSLGDGNIIL